MDGTRVTALAGAGRPLYAATGLAAAVSSTGDDAARLANTPAAGPDWGDAPLPGASLRARFEWRNLTARVNPALPAGRADPNEWWLKRLSPLAFSLSRTPTGLTFAARQPLTPKLAGELLDAAAGWGP